MKKVNISSISNKIKFIYGDECEKNTVGLVIFSDGTDYYFDSEYKNKMSNEELEALLLRGAVVFKNGKYYKPASFNDENVSYGGAVVDPGDIEVDLSAYATKEYIDDEIEKIELTPGPKGEQGPKGEDGLTTSISVNGSTFVQQNGVITLPDYPEVKSQDVVTPFLGGTANFLGDSQTEANSYKTKIYHEWVKEILGLASVNNYGISGTTITKKTSSDTTAMCVRYNNMSSSADLICVMGGVNDVVSNSPLGVMGDTDPLTFYGAMDTLCKGLYIKFPGKTIVFITPTEQNNAEFTNYNTIGTCVGDYARAMRMVCAKYGIKVFDAHATLGIYPYVEQNKSYYTTDGLHLNDAANEKLGKELSNFILYGSQLLVHVNEGPEVKPFVGKTVTYNPVDGRYPVHFVLVCNASDLNVGETLAFNMKVSNVSGVPFTTSNGGGGIFYSESNKAGDGLFVETTGYNHLVATITDDTVSHNLVLSSSYDPNIASYVKIAYGLVDIAAGETCSFTIDSISLTCGGRKIDIIDIGAFFAEEGCSVD